MPSFRRFLVATAVALAALPATAGETLQYAWSMHGGLSWLAGLRFPTSGTGELTQIANGPNLTSTLRITSPQDPSASLVYESTMVPSGEKTLASAEGYDWRNTTRHTTSFFDSVKQLLHIRRTTSAGTHSYVKPWKSDVRDVLTAIQFLRVSAQSLLSPMTSTVYSGGKAYPVRIAPMGNTTLNVRGATVATTEFCISAAPGAAAKYPGEVRLWISSDARRVPVRIELAQRFATLRLDLM